MEAGSQAFRIARRLAKNVGSETIVLNPGEVAIIYESLKKTDKEDALKLARLAQRHPREELPTVEIPTEKQEAIRRLSTEQAHWSEMISMSKNRLHSVFVEAGIVHLTRSHLSQQKNRLEAFELLPEVYRAEASRLMRDIDHMEGLSAELDEQIRDTLKENMDYTTLVMSMPGVGPILALALLGYLGDGKRFSSAKQVGFFVGLVPKVQISGKMVHYGHIVHTGCKPIRRVIIQAAWALTRSDEGGDLRAFYQRLHPIKGKKKAIVAVARKMAEILYCMVRNGEFYRHADPTKLDKKLKYYRLHGAAA
jgi:transposase